MEVTICVFLISVLDAAGIKFKGCRLMVDRLMEFWAAKIIFFDY